MKRSEAEAIAAERNLAHDQMIHRGSNLNPRKRLVDRFQYKSEYRDVTSLTHLSILYNYLTFFQLFQSISVFSIDS